MKNKVLLIIIISLFLFGCADIKDKDIPSILNNLPNTINTKNTFHTGYKYLLPKGMSVKEYMLYNDIIETNNYEYYLYVDTISYYHKVKNNYKENNDLYYSKKIDFGKKSGYLEINLKENNQYLIEIMYNYAKIEVMVDKEDINLAIYYSVSILRSIEYNDSIIKSLVEDENVTYQEEIYNIFNTTSSDSNYLKVIESENQEENIDKNVTSNNTTKDIDLIS